MKRKRKPAAHETTDELRARLLQTRAAFLQMIRDYPELCCADSDAEDFSTMGNPKLDHRRYIARPPRVH